MNPKSLLIMIIMSHVTKKAGSRWGYGRTAAEGITVWRENT